MPTIFNFLFSLIVYPLIFWLGWKKRKLIRVWPRNPTLFRIWILWIFFLILFAPLSYHPGDMHIWTGSVRNLLQGGRFLDNFTYLPLYAQIQAGLAWPFFFLGVKSNLLFVYVIKLIVIFSYVFCAVLMAKILPDQSELAPLGIVLAPVSIYYIFFGTNHIVMLMFLLLSLMFLKKEKWFWSGFFAFFSCYKLLLFPTILVMVVIIALKYGVEKTSLFILGGLLFLLPNLIYYSYDPYLFFNTINNQGAIGINSVRVEMFHFFYLLKNHYPGFESLYVGKKIWLYLSLLGIPISLVLFWIKRLNFLQCLAFSYAFVTIFSTEPYRLEPLIGLLWLDSVYRKDLLLQTGVFIVSFVHAATWYDWANFRYLIFDPSAPLHLWGIRGFYLGLAIIVVLLTLLSKKDKRALFWKRI